MNRKYELCTWIYESKLLTKLILEINKKRICSIKDIYYLLFFFQKKSDAIKIFPKYFKSKINFSTVVFYTIAIWTIKKELEQFCAISHLHHNEFFNMMKTIVWWVISLYSIFKRKKSVVMFLASSILEERRLNFFSEIHSPSSKFENIKFLQFISWSNPLKTMQLKKFFFCKP